MGDATDNGRDDITALTPAGRAEELAARGEPAFRAGQLERWLFARAAASFDEMTDFPKALRDELASQFYIPCPTEVDAAAGDDGAVKYLFRTYDGEHVEAVYLPGEDHDAVCLSSQLGCPLDCRMCATATLPFRRNLSAYEICAQFALLQRRHPASRIRNVVFMGQGEPLLNYDAVVAAVALLREHFAVGARRITVSTAGIPEKIIAWANGGPPTKLAVSLSSAVAATRAELMPAAARYPLADVAAACRHYARRTRRRLTFEYVICAGVNDDLAHARALVAFTRDIPSKVNVIPMNRWPGARYEPPDEGTLAAFLAEVARGPRALTVRRARGAAAAAACGTLANRVGAAA